VSKPAIILGKGAAYTLRAVLMAAAGVLASFLVLSVDSLGGSDAWLTLGKSLAVVVLAVIAYTAFFTFIGTFLKKSVLFGLFFCFGWENVVQYFPGTTQKLTVMHYLKSILRPEMPTGNALQTFLYFRLEPSPVVTAVLTLLVFAAAAMALAAVVFSRKEYLFDE
jgi:ABC-2 type transport system permease protein